MSDYLLRPFSWPKLEGLFRARAAVLGPQAAQVPHDFESLESFRAQLEMPGREATRDIVLACTAAEVVGFGLIQPEQAIGRAVGELAVAPPHRNRHVGRSLLERMLQACGKLDLPSLHIQDVTGPTALSQLLLKVGFEPIRTVYKMERPAGRALPPTPANAVNICLRHFGQAGDAALLAELQNEAFAGSFGFCPNDAAQIAAYVDMRGGPESILLADLEPGSQAVGYVWTSTRGRDACQRGLIEMIGVRPGARGKGIASLLLTAALNELRKRGVRSVGLEVDAANETAIALYHRFGFEKCGQSHWFAKQVG